MEDCEWRYENDEGCPDVPEEEQVSITPFIAPPFIDTPLSLTDFRVSQMDVRLFRTEKWKSFYLIFSLSDSFDPHVTIRFRGLKTF